MRFIIPTCNKYLNFIQAKKYTMDKFGGKDLDVTILGYEVPTFDLGSWDFISLGNDTGPQSYSNDIFNFFKDFKDEYFIYGNDDCVILDEMNIDLIDEFKSIMDNDKDVVKIVMTPAAKRNYTGDKYSDNLIESKQSADFRLSLHYSMWRTSYFMKYFEPNLSPWQWELRDIAKNDGKKILGTINKHVIDLGHIARIGGKIRPTWYISEETGVSLPNEDVEYLKRFIKK